MFLCSILNNSISPKLCYLAIKSKILDLMWKSIDDDVKQENWLKSFNELKEDNLNNKQFGSQVADIVSILGKLLTS
jgi:hypothetical protein